MAIALEVNELLEMIVSKSVPLRLVRWIATLFANIKNGFSASSRVAEIKYKI